MGLCSLSIVVTLSGLEAPNDRPKLESALDPNVYFFLVGLERDSLRSIVSKLFPPAQKNKN